MGGSGLLLLRQVLVLLLFHRVGHLDAVFDVPDGDRVEDLVVLPAVRVI